MFLRPSCTAQGCGGTLPRAGASPGVGMEQLTACWEWWLRGLALPVLASCPWKPPSSLLGHGESHPTWLYLLWGVSRVMDSPIPSLWAGSPCPRGVSKPWAVPSHPSGLAVPVPCPAQPQLTPPQGSAGSLGTPSLALTLSVQPPVLHCLSLSSLVPSPSSGSSSQGPWCPRSPWWPAE